MPNILSKMPVPVFCPSSACFWNSFASNSICDKILLWLRDLRVGRGDQGACMRMGVCVFLRIRTSRSGGKCSYLIRSVEMASKAAMVPSLMLSMARSSSVEELA